MFVFHINFITVYSDDWLQKCVKDWRSKPSMTCMESTVDQYLSSKECWVFVMSSFTTVTAPARVCITHYWTPNKSLCTVCLQVAVAIARNSVYTSIWCVSWVPWSFSNSCLQKVNSHDVLLELGHTHTHTLIPAFCPTCLIVTLKRSSSSRNDLQNRSVLKQLEVFLLGFTTLTFLNL